MEEKQIKNRELMQAKYKREERMQNMIKDNAAALSTSSSPSPSPQQGLYLATMRS